MKLAIIILSLLGLSCGHSIPLKFNKDILKDTLFNFHLQNPDGADILNSLLSQILENYEKTGEFGDFRIGLKDEPEVTLEEEEESTHDRRRGRKTLVVVLRLQIEYNMPEVNPPTGTFSVEGRIRFRVRPSSTNNDVGDYLERMGTYNLDVNLELEFRSSTNVLILTLAAQGTIRAQFSIDDSTSAEQDDEGKYNSNNSGGDVITITLTLDLNFTITQGTTVLLIPIQGTLSVRFRDPLNRMEKITKGENDNDYLNSIRLGNITLTITGNLRMTFAGSTYTITKTGTWRFRFRDSGDDDKNVSNMGNNSGSGEEVGSVRARFSGTSVFVIRNAAGNEVTLSPITLTSTGSFRFTLSRTRGLALDLKGDNHDRDCSGSVGNTNWRLVVRGNLNTVGSFGRRRSGLIPSDNQPNTLSEHEYLPKGLEKLFQNNQNQLLRSEGHSDAENIKIYGGQVAEKKQYPYQVGLSLEMKDGRKSWCGGALISDSYVLTAAHCLMKIRSAVVMLGAHDRSQTDEAGRVNQIIKSKNFIIHSGWKTSTMKNDIALIKLDNKVEITDQIKPIALPKLSQGPQSFDKAEAIVSGWGRYDSSNQLSQVLRHATSTVLSNSSCKTVFGKYVHSSNVCLNGEKGRGTCNGDSGGPMAVKAEDGQPLLIGLTSYGSSQGCGKGLPTVFTRVTSHLDWIAKKTGIEVA